MATLGDYLKLHFIVLIWGFTAVLGLLIAIGPLEVVFYRTLLASIFILPFLLVKKKSLKVRFRPLILILFTGFLIAGHWILFFLSARVSNASVCLAGMATVALWTSFIEPIYYNKKLKAFEVFLGLVVIVGLYVIFQFEFDKALGLIIAVASAFLSALFSVINSQLTRQHDAYVITFYEMLAACVTTFLFFPVVELLFPAANPISLAMTTSDFLYMLALSLVCTVYAFSESVELMRRISAYAMNLTVNLEPIYGMILAILFLGENKQMSSGFYWGTLIILLSVLSYPILNRYFKRKALDPDILR
jgi:drug/metabolite transporter (DMT)-like permease